MPAFRALFRYREDLARSGDRPPSAGFKRAVLAVLSLQSPSAAELGRRKVGRLPGRLRGHSSRPRFVEPPAMGACDIGIACSQR